MNGKKSLLYTIQHPSTTKIDYLFGTMHLATTDAFTHFDLACNYMTLCSSYVGEMDLSTGESLNQEHPFSFDFDQSLCDYVSFKKISKYSRICNIAFGFQLTNYLNYKPMFILAMITESMFEKSGGESLDLALTSHALHHGLEIGGLETYQEQMDIAKRIPLDYQLKSFKDALGNVTKFRRDTLALTKAYATGNLKLLAKKSNSSMGSIKSLMLYDRNVIMTRRIVERIKSQSEGASFFSLGAGHICGSNNIIKLLAQQGFLVKPVFQ
jgi:hypothetical protein